MKLQEHRLPDKQMVAEAMDLYRSFYREPTGGQQQRLSVALALAGRPTVAVLDELTTGLDPQARRDTWDLIGAGLALSGREREVLQLVADGAGNREAARRLFISEASVKTHLQHSYDKLGVRDRAVAVAEGYRRGLLR